MIGTTSSAHNCYQRPAIGEFFWTKHKFKDKAGSIQLTITPSVMASMTGQTASHVSLSIQFNGPIAGFDKPGVSDKYNEGPFMDIMSYHFKPIGHDSTCTFDSAAGTPIKKALSILQNNKSLNLGFNPVLGHHQVPLINAALLLGVANNTTKTQQTEKEEFEQRQYLNGKEKHITYSMTKCYNDEELVQYNSCSYSSLKHSHHGGRVAMGFVPIFGWFGGWSVIHDCLYKVPDTATSTITANWGLNYDVDKNASDVKFKWKIEVRTVFCSNAGEIPEVNGCKSILNWIATVHQVTYFINIKLNIPDVQLSITEKKRRLVCAYGYEGTTSSVKYTKSNGTSKTYFPSKGNTAQAELNTALARFKTPAIPKNSLETA